jgi:hypothetical protein
MWINGQEEVIWINPLSRLVEQKRIYDRKKKTHQKTNTWEAEIQGLLHPAEYSLGYFLAWFLVLPAALNSLKVLLHLNAVCLLKYALYCE